MTMEIFGGGKSTSVQRADDDVVEPSACVVGLLGLRFRLGECEVEDMAIAPAQLG